MFMFMYVLFYLGQLSHFPSCFGAGITNLNEPPLTALMNQDLDEVVPLMGVLMTRRAVLLEFVHPTFKAEGERLLTNTGSRLQQA